MTIVTKEEATALRKEIKDVTIVRTMKQKSGRHRYFVEETAVVLAILSKLRK